MEKQNLERFFFCLLKLLGLYALILLIAAFITPLLTPLIQSQWPKVEFDKIFDRLRYLGLLLMLPILWQLAGLKSWSDFGWGKWKVAGWFALAGAASVCLLGFLVIVKMGAAELPILSKLPFIITRAVIAAVVVSFIEEIVFRGILQRILIRTGGLWLGVIVSSLIFGILHGRPSPAWVQEPKTLIDGFNLASYYLATWPANISPMTFVNLSFLGAALGILYIRWKSLLVPIGFHTGIVAAAIPVSALIGQTGLSSQYLISAPETTILLLLWTCVVNFWPKKKKD